MARLNDLGVAKRLSLIVVVGALALLGVAVTANNTDVKLAGHAESLENLERGRTALEHLDTRESELKVDAYRSALGQNVSGEVREDLASVVEAIAAVDAAGMPAELAATFDSIRPDLSEFSDFIKDFTAAAAADPRGVSNRMNEIVERNSAVDERLAALSDQVDAAVADSRVDLEDARSTGRNLILLVGVVGLLLLIGLSIPLVRSILRPVREVGRVVGALAAGDLTQRTGIDSRDELGRLAAGVDAAVETISRSVRTMAAHAHTLAGAANEVTSVATQIASAAEDTNSQTGSASAESEEISRNVQTVAAGAEEMGLSIREISNNASEAAQIAGVAVTEAARATETIEKLGESSTEIGNVIKLITSIAEQTNLLALNATIEAARAGDAGKGFAVVASEVKDLAQETARATEDISSRVAAIQADTGGAVDVINRISEVIAKINAYQTTIASAVEEQTATTAEMSRSISEVASSSNRIAVNISDVAEASAGSVDGINQARQASTDVARTAEEMRALVATFRIS
jgi:methyl-accepting chemotaxis protein